MVNPHCFRSVFPLLGAEGAPSQKEYGRVGCIKPQLSRWKMKNREPRELQSVEETLGERGDWQSKQIVIYGFLALPSISVGLNLNSAQTLRPELHD